MSYRGPVALTQSKHASPLKKARSQDSPASTPPTTAIVTKDQMKAAMELFAGNNPDKQLAMRQAEGLRNEVDAHSSQLNSTVSSTITTTRQLLSLIRDALNKDTEGSPPGLMATEELWNQLEQLSEAAKKAKHALPQFLERQKESMSLYHSAMTNEAIQESQAELNHQHKKVNIQHSLILEHQQQFVDYKEKTDVKLREREELQERVSRLTLDKGLLKTELDHYVKMADAHQASRTESERLVQALRLEVDRLKQASEDAGAFSATLSSTIGDIQEKLKATERAKTDYHESAQRHEEQCGKERQKAIGLDSLVRTLQGSDASTKKQYAQLMADFKDQRANYESQTAELAQLVKEHVAISKLHDLLKVKMDESEKLIIQLKEQIDGMKRELATEQQKVNTAQEESKASAEKVKKLEAKYDALEMKNKGLQDKETEHTKVAKNLVILKEENAKLSNSVLELQKKSSDNTRELAEAERDAGQGDDKLCALQDQIIKLKDELEQWTELANCSFQEYNKILPVYEEAEVHRQAAKEKEVEITKLQLELKALKASSQPNGASKTSQPVGDAAYWKEKYESLVAQY